MLLDTSSLALHPDADEINKEYEEDDVQMGEPINLSVSVHERPNGESSLASIPSWLDAARIHKH